jgi:hypothetical protein
VSVPPHCFWAGGTLRAPRPARIHHISPRTHCSAQSIPVQIVGLVFVFGVSWWLGRREEKRLGYSAADGDVPMPQRELTDEQKALRRPKNFWFNIVLTLVVLGTMVVMGEKIPPAIMFMVGLYIALLVNYPNVDMQRQRIDAHARAALMMAGILLAAGVFTGVMQGSGMLKAMAQAAVGFVPLARLGFPIGEVQADGSVTITKVAHAGGRVTEATCKEQLLYEIHDPRRYLQPDVVADFTQVRVVEEAADRVRVSGGRGISRTGTLKVTLAYVDGFIGEGQISYGGPGAAERAQLALEIVRERRAITGVSASELRFDLIGIDSLHGATLGGRNAQPYEVRVRVAGRTNSMAEAVRIGNEVETLYTNGPAGGGGVTKTAREVIAVQSVLLLRELVKPSFEIVEQ